MTLGTSWESDTRGGSAKVERGAKRQGRRTPSVLLTFWEPPCDAPRAAVRPSPPPLGAHVEAGAVSLLRLCRSRLLGVHWRGKLDLLLGDRGWRSHWRSPDWGGGWRIAAEGDGGGAARRSVKAHTGHIPDGVADILRAALGRCTLRGAHADILWDITTCEAATWQKLPTSDIAFLERASLR